MDVGRLRVLRELADRGSVTAVAAALSFTPSAISAHLATSGSVWQLSSSTIGIESELSCRRQ